MRLTLRQLDVMVAIARSGSTTEAGKQLALSQSAVSAALAELESQLGTRVFDRVGKRVVLNDCGRLLLPRALALLDQVREVETLFADGAAALRVSASTTIGNYLMPVVLGAYQRRWPLAQIQLEVCNTQDVIQAVADYAVDVGFIEGACHHDELEIHPWVSDELAVVAAPGHPLAQGPVRLDKLATARWILREPGSGTRETVEALLLPHLQRFGSTMHLGNSEAIKHAVAEELGVSCLPLRVVHDLLIAERLVRVATPLPTLIRTLYRIQPKRKVFSPPLQRFIDHCSAWHETAT
ncbi:MAG: LysR family transcriptional regulator [Betaproteobacteria bacterium]|nr:LysR family transcriptional regulator [Betaproteobacteria bacterium]MDE2122058.1 LysR family transcriptional regulator [Betaproteobacteria bacterium]MDE2187242.1 LysR family transcriptional regulator [Betaproteobacteria bacterium]MDE2325155.1 LysR family transcriptional regulator [Betaproteobacteria bacterium]